MQSKGVDDHCGQSFIVVWWMEITEPVYAERKTSKIKEWVKIHILCQIIFRLVLLYVKSFNKKMQFCKYLP